MIEVKESDFFQGGKGVDVSFNHVVQTAIHRYIEPSQLYLLHKEIGFETFDYLFARDIINETKYYRILLYEWFLAVKAGGYLIIEFNENRIMDLSELKKEINALQLYKYKYKIEVELGKGKRKKIVIHKTASTKNKKNEIDQWTFGMVTNGKRADLIERSINSIRALKIPSYEIIICGRYGGEIAGDIKYLHFTEKDDKGWITKKKNLICDEASYNNIVVFHDRISFSKDWLEGMRKWGANFEVLSFPIYYPNEKILRYNWDTMGFFASKEKLNKLRSTSGALDPTDWDPHVFIGGPVIALKKHIWSIAKWDENLFWGDSEDLELSYRQHLNGIMLRFNHFAQVNSSIVTVALMGFHYRKNKEKLGRYIMNPFLSVLLQVLDFVGLRRDQKIVRQASHIINSIYKTKNWTRG